MVISGGAPLRKDISKFFHAVGLLVLEGYGLTETMAAATINFPDEFKFGTVGKPLKGVQIRLEEDGEVIVKGPQVFRGYKNKLDEANGNDGWFKTGDLGEFSRDGFLRLTGRKKEIIVTASGKNIAPQRVENLFKTSQYIKDICVYGDQRKYLSAIITLELERAKEYANKNGIRYETSAELIDNDKMYELIKSEIECKNKQLARHETIKKFVIINHEFTTESGELTPTMKLRRYKIYEKYKSELENLYK